MSQPSILPEPLASLPWRVVFIVLAIGGFGLVVLYSAAGGSFKPWAESQGIKFAVFIIMALAHFSLRELLMVTIVFRAQGGRALTTSQD